MKLPRTPRTVYLLRIRPEPDVTDEVRALRTALKLLLRRCSLRCISLTREASQ
jgi:hypothetical protein